MLSKSNSREATRTDQYQNKLINQRHTESIQHLHNLERVVENDMTRSRSGYKRPGAII